MYVTKWKKSNWKAYILYEFHYKNSRWNIIPITYKVCPEGIQTCVTKNRDIYWRYMMQETLCTGQCHLSPLHSWHLGMSHSSPNHHPLPCPIPESHLWSEISSLSKVILVLGKARSHRVSNLDCKSPGWFDVLPKNSIPDVMREWAHCHDEAANHPLPIQICCSTCSVSLIVMATQYTCSLNHVYYHHWLVQ